MKFIEKLEASISKKNSLLCVGLDSDIGKIPREIVALKNSQFRFNKRIIDATAPFVCAFKPNSAFYEACGIAGIEDLKRTIQYINSQYPEIPVILDAKRGDIGNTNSGYVDFAYTYLHADAITVHPYLGREALSPFLEKEDKQVFVLCKTSNPGSGEFQNIESNGKPIYQIVAKNVAREWNAKNNCGLVVGATYPEELSIVRGLIGDMPILIPGIGAQGGDLEKTVKAGINSKKTGAIITSSRSILFASKDNDFDQKAAQEAERLKNAINSFR